MMNLGEIIKQLRELLGLTQDDLAQKTDLSSAYIRKIEKGRVTNIGLEKFIDIAETLGEDPGNLLHRLFSKGDPGAHIGCKFAIIRKFRGIPKKVLSEKTGISVSEIEKLENQRTTLTKEKLHKIAKILNVDLDLVLDKGIFQLSDVCPHLYVTDSFFKSIPIIPMDWLVPHLFSDYYVPEGRASQTYTPRNIELDELSYAVPLGKHDDAMAPIEKGWTLYVSPEIEVKSGDFVIVGIRATISNGIDVEGSAIFRQVTFQGDDFLFSAYNSRYKPVLIKKTEINFMHKVVLMEPEKNKTQEKEAPPEKHKVYKI